MKSLFHSELSKATLLIVPLAFWLGGSTTAQAGDRDPLFPGAIRPGDWNYQAESRQGYLKVYSASDIVRDGDTVTSHTPLTSFTRSTEGCLKTLTTTVQRSMKFPSSCRCQLDPTES